MPVILATEEAEIRRIIVWSHTKQISSWDPISKIYNTKKAGGMAQGVDPEYNPQYCKKNCIIVIIVIIVVI
jgi:hypothetical protein